ncbi:hypothetical protein ACRAWF_24860 [Streptomyces sp. L7]
MRAAASVHGGRKLPQAPADARSSLLLGRHACSGTAKLPLWLLLTRTRIGLAIQAALDASSEMVESCWASNVPRRVRAAWSAAAARFAALAGVIGGRHLRLRSSPMAVVLVGLIIFVVVVVIGGIGSPPPAPSSPPSSSGLLADPAADRRRVPGRRSSAPRPRTPSAIRCSSVSAGAVSAPHPAPTG